MLGIRYFVLALVAGLGPAVIQCLALEPLDLETELKLSLIHI